MVSSVKFTLVLIILVTVSCTSYALKCYKCDNEENYCNYELKRIRSEWIVNCPKTATHCIKIINEMVKPVYIVRDCSNKTVDSEVCKESVPGPKVNCEFCTTDLCNGNSSATPIIYVNGFSSSSSFAPNTGSNGLSSSSSIGPIAVTISFFFSLALFLA